MLRRRGRDPCQEPPAHPLRLRTQAAALLRQSSTRRYVSPPPASASRSKSLGVRGQPWMPPRSNHTPIRPCPALAWGGVPLDVSGDNVGSGRAPRGHELRALTDGALAVALVAQFRRTHAARAWARARYCPRVAPEARHRRRRGAAMLKCGPGGRCTGKCASPRPMPRRFGSRQVVAPSRPW